MHNVSSRYLDLLFISFMKNFVTYMSTAPVVRVLTVSGIAGFIIEINRFFPDSLIFSF